MHEVVVMAVRAAVKAAMMMRSVTSQNLPPIFIANYIFGGLLGFFLFTRHN